MKPLTIFFLFLIFTKLGYSQVNNVGKNDTSELVFLIDSNLKDLIKEIIKKDNSCRIEGYDWYIDFMKNDMILISKYSIENLIATKKDSQIYTTTIDDKILFILNTENIKDVFNKSGYSVDLSYFIDKSNYSTIDYSFWVIQKNEKKDYQIIKEKKYRCN